MPLSFDPDKQKLIPAHPRTAPTTKFKLIVAYDGTQYQGWQVQKIGTGVQEKLEEALAKLSPGKPRVHSLSRTDTGVHALAMVVHVELPRSHFRMSGRKLALALNAWLAEDIRVLSATRAHKDFHARFDATGKQYRYFIWNHPTMNPLIRRTAWHVPRSPTNQRIHRRMIPDEIAVLFARGVETRVEIFVRPRGGEHTDVLRQPCIESKGQFSGGHPEVASWQLDVDHHGQRVNAGVSATQAMDARFAWREFRQRFFELFLHAGADLLHLPTLVLGAVVSDDQFEFGGRSRKGHC